MKTKKKPMPLWQKITYAICFIFLIWTFIFLGTRDYKVKELSDSELFHKEFKTISIDNSFMVLDSKEALTLLEKGTGLLFLGFPENRWSASIAEILDVVSKKQHYPISYFNFKDERDDRHDNYIGIIREVDDYLKSDDEGNLDLWAPTIIGIVKGKVIYFNDELTFMNNMLDPRDFWTEDKKEEMKTTLEKVIVELKAQI